jgi:hypothetical protein
LVFQHWLGFKTANNSGAVGDYRRTFTKMSVQNWINNNDDDDNIGYRIQLLIGDVIFGLKHLSKSKKRLNGSKYAKTLCKWRVENLSQSFD